MNVLRWFRQKPAAREENKTVVKPHAPRPRIWAIGGGKGGVGKTLVTSSLGILLASSGKKVLIVDADFGAANLHTFFGVRGAQASLSNFLKGEAQDFASLVVDSGVMNLYLACGEKDSLDVADLSENGVLKLRSALFKAPYDHVLLDVGPGSASNHLDLFLMSQKGIIVTSSEPTSVENSYRFLKCLFLRKMRNAVNASDDNMLKDALHRLFANNFSQRVKTISDILHQLERMDPGCGRPLKELLGDMNYNIIVNNVNGAVDPDFGPSMARACTDYFGIGIRHIGDIGRDESVPESVKLRRPLIINAPESDAAKALKECFKRLTSSEEQTNEKTSRGMMT